MQITAKLKYLRLTPRKVRTVLDVIRGLDVISAEAQLIHLPKRVSQLILKLLNSAVNNALNRYVLKKEDLYIKEIFADEGPTLYRWFPRAFGRATPLRKRSSHITIVFSTKKEVVAKEKIERKEIEQKLKKETPTKIEDQAREIPKTYEKKRREKKMAKEDLRLKRRESFIKKIFKRKTI